MYRSSTDMLITFKHINVHGLNPRDDIMDFNNAMDILNKIEAGVYSLDKTQWDTTNPTFHKYIQQTIKKYNKYSQVEFGSNINKEYNKNWRPGGTLISVSGGWGSKV